MKKTNFDICSKKDGTEDHYSKRNNADKKDQYYHFKAKSKPELKTVIPGSWVEREDVRGRGGGGGSGMAIKT